MTKSVRKRRSIRAATMIELIAAVAIIAILLSLGMNDFLSAKNRADEKSISDMLYQIDSAKERCALDQVLQTGASCTITNTLLPAAPNWPYSGTYVEGVIGTPATFNGKNANQWAPYK